MILRIFRDCARSDSEKEDIEKKQKNTFLLISANGNYFSIMKFQQNHGEFVKKIMKAADVNKLFSAILKQVTVIYICVTSCGCSKSLSKVNISVYRIVQYKMLENTFMEIFLWVRLNYATTHHHPPPPTTSQNISTTTHHQPKYIHQHPPRPTNSQNLFYKKPIYKNLQPLSDGNVRNLNSRPAIAKKLFLHGPLHYFYYIHQKWS